MTLEARHCLLLPLGVTLVSSVALAIVGLVGWPGEVGSSGMVFCEASAPGIVKQPMNTWSNLGFVAAGLWIGLTAYRHFSSGGGGDNRMLARIGYPTLYATVAAFVGPGSMALHASTTTWGGMIDIMSMFFWASFIVAYGLARVFETDDRQFTIAYVVIIGIVSVLYLGRLLPFSGSALFGVLLVVYALTETWLFFRRPDIESRRAWMFGALAVFLIAFGIWLPSRTDGPWCDPHSMLQGHAAWHLLNAVAMVLLYRYFVSERRTLRE